MTTRSISFERIEDILTLFGNFDENIKLIEKSFSVTIVSRGGEVTITGDVSSVNKAFEAISQILSIIGNGEVLSDQSVRYIISLIEQGSGETIKDVESNAICISAKGKPIKPKTLGQKKYVKAIADNIVTFGVGPAGTGKTFLAVAMAVASFRAGDVSRIILTRPAVEAGEHLGFLPGDLQNKVDPYLRPLYDALFEMLGSENFTKYLERGTIEVAPLAYMRGRTLDDSFIILDEAQNTTREQMKMFLTRLGFGAKAVITGDDTQIDLGDNKKSGLIEAIRVLSGVEEIDVVRLSAKDVVRHRVVQRIINAYEKSYKGQGEK